MSHHGREYEDDHDRCGASCDHNARIALTLTPFVRRLADAELGLDPDWTRQEAERVLVSAGLPCRAHRLVAQAKAKRAAELDAEIERLRAERAKL